MMKPNETEPSTPPSSMPPAKQPVETPEELAQWRKENRAQTDEDMKRMGEKIREAVAKGVPVHKIIPVN